MITTYNGQNQSSDISVLVCHGSMQTKFDQFHPLVQYFQKMFKTVYSMELPGHGSQRQYDDVSTLTPVDLVDIMFKEIDSTCPRQKLFITSYSVSGLLFIKMWEKLLMRNSDLKGIFIGTGITIRATSKLLITRFFSEEMYLKLGWENIMIRQHGPNWRKTIKMINNWFQGDLDILPTDHEIEILFKENEKKNIFFILGTKDQPFKKEDILNSHNFTLYEVDGDHFGYFVFKKAWPEVNAIIEKKLQEWYPKQS